jgi:hypothetical protein
LESVRHTPLCTPPLPTFQLHRFLSLHLFKKKNNSASWYNPSEQFVCFFVFLFSHKRKFPHLVFRWNTSSLHRAKDSLLGDDIGAVGW